MSNVRNGLQAGFPYSLSRWTDVPAAKWDWFKASMDAGMMVAFDPTNGIPSRWSLKPEDTMGLVFWTKDPTNLIRDAAVLRRYPLRIHVTLTGWEEVEKGAPDLATGAELLADALRTFGPSVVTWRFSPVPQVSDAVERFEAIAEKVGPAGANRVFLAFLQENDRMPETRSADDRIWLMAKMAHIGEKFGIHVDLCNEDRTLAGLNPHRNLSAGICAPPEDFALPAGKKAASEGCGCVLMVDPFTINESCTMGCTYCYAADQGLSSKKRNTTKGLPVVK